VYGEAVVMAEANAPRWTRPGRSHELIDERERSTAHPTSNTA